MSFGGCTRNRSKGMFAGVLELFFVDFITEGPR
jgi:hypothetical protein